MADVPGSSNHGKSPPDTLRVRINNSELKLHKTGETLHFNATVMDQLPPNFKNAIVVPHRIDSNGHLVVEAGLEEDSDERESSREPSPTPKKRELRPRGKQRSGPSAPVRRMTGVNPVHPVSRKIQDDQSEEEEDDEESSEEEDEPETNPEEDEYIPSYNHRQRTTTNTTRRSSRVQLRQQRESVDTSSPLPDVDNDDSETETSVEPPYSGNWRSQQSLDFSQQMQRRESQIRRHRQTEREQPEDETEANVQRILNNYTQVTEGGEEASAPPVQAAQSRNNRLLKSGFNDEFARIIQEQKEAAAAGGAGAGCSSSARPMTVPVNRAASATQPNTRPLSAAMPNASYSVSTTQPTRPRILARAAPSPYNQQLIGFPSHLKTVRNFIQYLCESTKSFLPRSAQHLLEPTTRVVIRRLLSKWSNNVAKLVLTPGDLTTGDLLNKVMDVWSQLPPRHSDRKRASFELLTENICDELRKRANVCQQASDALSREGMAERGPSTSKPVGRPPSKPIVINTITQREVTSPRTPTGNPMMGKPPLPRPPIQSSTPSARLLTNSPASPFSPASSARMANSPASSTKMTNSPAPRLLTNSPASLMSPSPRQLTNSPAPLSRPPSNASATAPRALTKSLVGPTKQPANSPAPEEQAAVLMGSADNTQTEEAPFAKPNAVTPAAQKEPSSSKPPVGNPATVKATTTKPFITNSAVQKESSISKPPASKPTAEQTPSTKPPVGNSAVQKESAISKPPASKPTAEQTPSTKPPVGNSEVEKESAISKPPASKTTAEQTPSTKPPVDNSAVQKESAISKPPASKPMAEQIPSTKPLVDNSETEKEPSTSETPSSTSTTEQTTSAKSTLDNLPTEKATVPLEAPANEVEKELQAAAPEDSTGAERGYPPLRYSKTAAGNITRKFGMLAGGTLPPHRVGPHAPAAQRAVILRDSNTAQEVPAGNLSNAAGSSQSKPDTNQKEAVVEKTNRKRERSVDVQEEEDLLLVTPKQNEPKRAKQASGPSSSLASQARASRSQTRRSSPNPPSVRNVKEAVQAMPITPSTPVVPEKDNRRASRSSSNASSVRNAREARQTTPITPSAPVAPDTSNRRVSRSSSNASSVRNAREARQTTPITLSAPVAPETPNKRASRSSSTASSVRNAREAGQTTPVTPSTPVAQEKKRRKNEAESLMNMDFGRGRNAADIVEECERHGVKDTDDSGRRLSGRVAHAPKRYGNDDEDCIVDKMLKTTPSKKLIKQEPSTRPATPLGDDEQPEAMETNIADKQSKAPQTDEAVPDASLDNGSLPSLVSPSPTNINTSSSTDAPMASPQTTSSIFPQKALKLIKSPPSANTDAEADQQQQQASSSIVVSPNLSEVLNQQFTTKYTVNKAPQFSQKSPLASNGSNAGSTPLPPSKVQQMPRTEPTLQPSALIASEPAHRGPTSSNNPVAQKQQKRINPSPNDPPRSNIVSHPPQPTSGVHDEVSINAPLLKSLLKSSAPILTVASQDVPSDEQKEALAHVPKEEMPNVSKSQPSPASTPSTPSAETGQPSRSPLKAQIFPIGFSLASEGSETNSGSSSSSTSGVLKMPLGSELVAEESEDAPSQRSTQSPGAPILNAECAEPWNSEPDSDQEAPRLEPEQPRRLSEITVKDFTKAVVKTSTTEALKTFLPDSPHLQQRWFENERKDYRVRIRQGDVADETTPQEVVRPIQRNIRHDVRRGQNGAHQSADHSQPHQRQKNDQRGNEESNRLFKLRLERGDFLKTPEQLQREEEARFEEEEEARKAHEEAERRRQEAEMRARFEEEARKAELRRANEVARKKNEEARKRNEAEQRKRIEEEMRKKMELAERIRREEEEKMKKDEEARIRREVEAELRKEAEEKLQREEAERQRLASMDLVRQQVANQLRTETECNDAKEKAKQELVDRVRKETEERCRKEFEEKMKHEEEERQKLAAQARKRRADEEEGEREWRSAEKRMRLSEKPDADALSKLVEQTVLAKLEERSGLRRSNPPVSAPQLKKVGDRLVKMDEAATKPELVSYPENSNVPLVLPDGCDDNFRAWKTDDVLSFVRKIVPGRLQQDTIEKLEDGGISGYQLEGYLLRENKDFLKFNIHFNHINIITDHFARVANSFLYKEYMLKMDAHKEWLKSQTPAQ